MQSFSTIPEMVDYIEKNYRNPKALNDWRGGKWVAISSQEMVHQIKLLAYGLISLGLKPGDKVAILSDSTACWTIADLAIILAGGVTVPLFDNLSDEHLVYEVGQANIRFLFVAGHEQWQVYQKFHYLFERVIPLEKAITLGAREREAKDALSYQDVLTRGADLQRKEPDLLSRISARAKPDDVATIVYTSGTATMPKGAEITHRNLLHLIAFETFGWGAPDDRYLSILPLAHIFARQINYIGIGRNIPCYYLTDLGRLLQALSEVRPTVMIVVPRLLEKIHAGILAKTQGLPWLFRKVAEWAYDLASNEEPLFFQKMLFPLADLLVWKKIREQFGGAFRVIICGGAALNRSLNQFFVSMGIPVYEGWGLTEGSTAVVNNPKSHKIGTVGVPLPGVKIKIAESGEILLGGPTVMKGYYRNEEATAKAIDHEGWLHTGDRGEIDEEGFLTIKGRIKEQFKLSTGEFISPVRIEKWLTQDPLIDRALVVGEGRHFAAVLLFPDPAYIKQLKKRYNAQDLSNEEFLKSRSIEEKVKQLIESVNVRVNRWERLQGWSWIFAVPSVQHGELTQAHELRRDAIVKKYQKQIKAIYNGGETA